MQPECAPLGNAICGCLSPVSLPRSAESEAAALRQHAAQLGLAAQQSLRQLAAAKSAVDRLQGTATRLATERDGLAAAAQALHKKLGSERSARRQAEAESQEAQRRAARYKGRFLEATSALQGAMAAAEESRSLAGMLAGEADSMADELDSQQQRLVAAAEGLQDRGLLVREAQARLDLARREVEAARAMATASGRRAEEAARQLQAVHAEELEGMRRQLVEAGQRAQAEQGRAQQAQQRAHDLQAEAQQARLEAAAAQQRVQQVQQEAEGAARRVEALEAAVSRLESDLRLERSRRRELETGEHPPTAQEALEAAAARESQLQRRADSLLQQLESSRVEAADLTRQRDAALRLKADALQQLEALEERVEAEVARVRQDAQRRIASFAANAAAARPRDHLPPQQHQASAAPLRSGPPEHVLPIGPSAPSVDMLGSAAGFAGLVGRRQLGVLGGGEDLGTEGPRVGSPQGLERAIAAGMGPESRAAEDDSLVSDSEGPEMRALRAMVQSI